MEIRVALIFLRVGFCLPQSRICFSQSALSENKSEEKFFLGFCYPPSAINHQPSILTLTVSQTNADGIEFNADFVEIKADGVQLVVVFLLSYIARAMVSSTPKISMLREVRPRM